MNEFIERVCDVNDCDEIVAHEIISETYMQLFQDETAHENIDSFMFKNLLVGKEYFNALLKYGETYLFPPPIYSETYGNV